MAGGRVRHSGKRMAAYILAVLVILTLTGGWMESRAEETGARFRTLADFKGKNISMLSGTSFDIHLEKNPYLLGNVNILYQNSDVDSISSVLSGKSDAMIMDMPNAEIVVTEHEELMIFPEVVQSDEYGFGFRKGDPLVELFNEALRKLLAQGLNDQMAAKWMGTDESAKKLIPQDWKGANGTLRFWVNTGTPPMGYLGPEGTPVGYAVDVVLHVAREMDYRVEITECAFDGLIPALQGGKADLAGRSMSITEERKKTIDFSIPFFRGGSVLVVRKDRVDPAILSTLGTAEEKAGNESGFFASIKTGFYRTFIQENRWSVFLLGLLRTLLITFASMTFGCVLGFALFFLCRRTGKTVRSVVQAVTGVIVGIPAVVLLMVLFYVVFGQSSISGIAVSILAFTLTFGTSVFHMLETGTGAVDHGQTEGAYALGFSDNETFFQVIFPQAILHILPIFQGELVALLKGTAVVGYIAVQDLTRAGDMIRNRTFEAFFSLIAVAVIYYLIGRLLILLIRKIQKRISPSSRTVAQILKGVKTNVSD